jgi:hypothetical protein
MIFRNLIVQTNLAEILNEYIMYVNDNYFDGWMKKLFREVK